VSFPTRWKACPNTSITFNLDINDCSMKKCSIINNFFIVGWNIMKSTQCTPICLSRDFEQYQECTRGDVVLDIQQYQECNKRCCGEISNNIKSAQEVMWFHTSNNTKNATKGVVVLEIWTSKQYKQTNKQPSLIDYACLLQRATRIWIFFPKKTRPST